MTEAAVMETVVRVVNPSGLHARPAALLVQEARKFQSHVSIIAGERSADAKSILAVLSMAVKPGTEVRVRAEGPDAPEAVAALAQLIRTGLGEGHGGQ
ncbi:MAG: HPr family phosphocarrier protein [Limnochordales bacterium]|nr:HPr family phosphocarrier protein [Limnochordales bacterium]